MRKNPPSKQRRRAASRIPTEAIVTCRHHTSGDGGRSVEGIMRNFSMEGSYIETLLPFRPGAIIFMRVLRYSPASPDTTIQDQPRSICLAEVKWQQALVEEETFRYGMGLRYLE